MLQLHNALVWPVSLGEGGLTLGGVQETSILNIRVQ